MKTNLQGILITKNNQKNQEKKPSMNPLDFFPANPGLSCAVYQQLLLNVSNAL